MFCPLDNKCVIDKEGILWQHILSVHNTYLEKVKKMIFRKNVRRDMMLGMERGPIL